MPVLVPGSPSGNPDLATLFDAADVRLLTELGFCAIGRGRLDAARQIFSGLLRIRAERAFAHIGLALTEIADRRPAAAVRILQSADAVRAGERPERDAFLGLALQLDGRRSASRQALEAATAGAPDNDGVKLALALLGRAGGRVTVARNLHEEILA